MMPKQAFRSTVLAAGLAALALPAPARQLKVQLNEPLKKDVPYVPTPPEVVQMMVQMAELKKGDVVYDLGCGDGRIVIAAVKVEGVRGVCVDIDPERIRESRHNAQLLGVADRIRFVEGDLFKVAIKDASVIMIYLMPDVNLRLKPRLLNELKPGTRVVSHAFSMGDWEPERRVEVGFPPDQRVVYKWVIPRRDAPPAAPAQ